jgi:hypothetical protein
LTQRKESGRPLPLNFVVQFILAAFAMLSVVRAQETPAPLASNEAKPLEIVIDSTEFKYVSVVRVFETRSGLN